MAVLVAVVVTVCWIVVYEVIVLTDTEVEVSYRVLVVVEVCAPPTATRTLTEIRIPATTIAAAVAR